MVAVVSLCTQILSQITHENVNKISFRQDTKQNTYGIYTHLASSNVIFLTIPAAIAGIAASLPGCTDIISPVGLQPLGPVAPAASAVV